MHRKGLKTKCRDRRRYPVVGIHTLYLGGPKFKSEPRVRFSWQSFYDFYQVFYGSYQFLIGFHPIIRRYKLILETEEVMK
jgi:hypothetical protein